MIGLQCISRDKHAQFDRQLEHVLFHAAMQVNVFSIDKTHQHILFCREIHSFVSIRSQLNSLLIALIGVHNQISRTQLGNYLFSDSKVSGTMARKTGSLHVHIFGLWPVRAINFSRDQSIDKLINFLDSILEIIEFSERSYKD